MQIGFGMEFEKQTQILKLLQFGTVMVFLDARKTGVVVPHHLKGDCQLRLNFDYAYEVEDFRILPDRLEASLSFDRKFFFCVIPLDAVYLMLCHHLQYGIFFAQSVPEEMRDFFVEKTNVEQDDEFKNNLNNTTQQSCFHEQPVFLKKKHLKLIKR